MPRFPRWIVAAFAAAAVTVLGSSAIGQQGGQVAARDARAQYPAIPGFYMLRQEYVQKELDLADEQKQKLQELGKKYYEDIRRDWTGLRDLSAEQRKAKYAEIREENQKRTEALRKEMEKVLSPQQLDALKQINLRSRGPYALQNPRILDQMGVTAQQKEGLRKLREEYQERTRQLQKESFEKCLEVLTPEQRKQFEEMGADGFQGIYAQPATPQK